MAEPIHIKILIFEGFAYLLFFSIIYFMNTEKFIFNIFPLLSVTYLIQQSIKRKKKILKYFTEEFKKLGFTVFSERPLNFSEISNNLKSDTVDGTILHRRYFYVRRFTRVIRVKSNNGKSYVLNVLVKIMWNGKHEIVIREKTHVPTDNKKYSN